LEGKRFLGGIFDAVSFETIQEAWAYQPVLELKFQRGNFPFVTAALETNCNI
jgi:hypothetical protein